MQGGHGRAIAVFSNYETYHVNSVLQYLAAGCTSTNMISVHVKMSVTVCLAEVLRTGSETVRHLPIIHRRTLFEAVLEGPLLRV